MKLLLSSVNSTHSLLGYDWDRAEIFWACPQQVVKCCGVCYDGVDLLISGDNFMTRITPTGYVRSPLTGTYDALAHSVHVIDAETVGVVDTGNSRVILLNRQGQITGSLDPISHWGQVPHDAIHLNDFVLTLHGLLASCFDYRPWRKVKEHISWQDWCVGGYGLVLNLTGNGKTGAGRIVGCGLNHPHSLTFEDPFLYLCSSSAGDFHVFEFDSHGVMREKKRYHVTHEHFLRGVYRMPDGWLLGGSAVRHGEVISHTTALYFLEEKTGRIEKKTVGGPGEIYDVLPWKDAVL